MAEEPLNIPVENGAISLEGLIEEGRTGRNVILCHPHPLFGGNMDNNVIQAARKAFASLGGEHCAIISGEQAKAAATRLRGKKTLWT